jgi:hypothetical protein
MASLMAAALVSSGLWGGGSAGGWEGGCAEGGWRGGGDQRVGAWVEGAQAGEQETEQGSDLNSQGTSRDA